MWTDNIQIEKVDKWLSARTKKIPSGNRDPYSSSMRSASRFISALNGTAESRESQLITDLTSAQLYNRDKGEKSILAVGLLNRCKQLSIPSDNELAIVLTLFLEALRCNNSYYKDIIRFWYEISRKMSIRELSHNVSVSYIISYFSDPDKDTGYIPLSDVSDIFAYTEMSSISVSALSDLNISETAKSVVQKLNDTIQGYTTRSSRAEMFQALDIMFSFDKDSTIDLICPPNINSDGNKLLKSIVGEYSAYFSFSSVLYESNFLKISINSNFELMNQPLQQIYYGAPGTGKSHATNDVTAKYPETVRTTFHPDSDYSTFVGAYKPTMTKVRKAVVIGQDEKEVNPLECNSEWEEKIVYKFVKQAFLKAYVKAWKLFKDTCVEGGELAPQFLVIEEINRGNCAQIFGDLFQLLDRKQNFSEYPVEADADICKALLEEDTEDNPSFGVEGLQLTDEQKAYINNVYDNKPVADKICKGKVLVLPPNLYIWATMNTSDQSLFPIDSAFKRRWDWEFVPIKYNNTDWLIEIAGVKYPWVDFQTEINKRIFDATESEDKQLGDYFVKANANDIISAKLLLNKVIFYLWNDVCKDGDGDIFKINTDLDYSKELDHSKDEDITFSQFFQGTDLKLQQWMRYLDIKPIEGGDEEQEEEKHQQEEGVKPADVKDTTYSKPIYQALVESMLSKVDNKDKDVSIFQNGFDWAFTNMPGSYTRMSLSLDAPARNKKATVKLWIPAPSGYKDSAACFNYLKEHNGEALVRNVAEKYNCSFEELGIHSAKPNPVVGWKIIVPITFSEDNVDAESGLLMQIMSEMRSAFDPIITDFQKK